MTIREQLARIILNMICGHACAFEELKPETQELFLAFAEKLKMQILESRDLTPLIDEIVAEKKRREVIIVKGEQSKDAEH